jgi:hypothetical protein
VVWMAVEIEQESSYTVMLLGRTTVPRCMRRSRSQSVRVR